MAAQCYTQSNFLLSGWGMPLFVKVCENAPPMRITVNGDIISEVSSLNYLGARCNAEALGDPMMCSGKKTNGKVRPPYGEVGL